MCSDEGDSSVNKDMQQPGNEGGVEFLHLKEVVLDIFIGKRKITRRVF